MIISKEELSKYLGNDINSLEGKVSSNTLDKLRNTPLASDESNLPVIDYIFLQHQKGNKSLAELSKEIGIACATLTRIFELYGLPKLTSAEATSRKWQ